MKEIYRKRFTAIFLLLTFISYNFSMAVFATEINLNPSLRTDTTINQVDNIWNIQTNTAVSGGKIGINSFNRFNVDSGHTVNLNLINQQSKLVNLIFDNSPSQINGIVNSYLNDKIGGNVLFANPNGFVIGESGVFNVGSLTLITPHEDSMKALMGDSGWNDAQVEKLISFTFGEDEYLIYANEYNPVKLASGKIDVQGKINSGGGIDLIAGSEITLANDSVLNANMKFEIDDGKLVAKANSISGIDKVEMPTKLAMQDGKNIVIVASNNNTSLEKIGAIVNMNGKVDANGGDVIARTEVFQTELTKEATREEIEDDNIQQGDVDYSENQIFNRNSASKIIVGEKAVINGNNVILRAVSKITGYDDNPLGLASDEYDTIIDQAGAFLLNSVVDYFYHSTDVVSDVTIKNGAKITADNNLDILALSDMSGLKVSGIYDYLKANLAINIASIKSNTTAIVKEGAALTAKNLAVKAETDIATKITTKSSNLLDRLTGKNPGSYAITISNDKITNKAAIEKGAKLNIQDDINVLAKTSAYQTYVTQNGLFPVIDKNNGPCGTALAVVIRDIVNEAIMNANTKIDGTLTVQADYEGKIDSQVVANMAGSGTFAGGGSGEDGILDTLLRHFTKMKNLNEVITRANAKYNKFGAAGAVGVVLDNVKSKAALGDSNPSAETNTSTGEGSATTVTPIKPEISAGKVIVKSTTLDNGSNLYATSSGSGAQKVAAGAVAVHVKNVDADSSAFADFTLNNTELVDGLPVDSIENDSLQIISKTEIKNSMAWFDWVKGFLEFFDKDNWSNVLQGVKDNWEAYDGNSLSGLVGKLSSPLELLDILDEGSLDILYAIDFANFGAAKFFSTFANSQANAVAGLGENTNAISGAIAVTLFNANSNALLDDASTVVIKSSNPKLAGVSVLANSENNVLTGAGLLNILEAKNILSGSSARDGSAFGVTGTYNYSESQVSAVIGKDVKIQKGTDQGEVGDVNVEAKENGLHVTVNIGSASPDNSGLSGAVGITNLGKDGLVKASIEEGATILNARNVTVEAGKNNTIVNSVWAFANGQNSYGVGLSGIILEDTVKAYIAGKILEAENIDINAKYDKNIANANLNVGVAKEGSDDTSAPSDEDILQGIYDLDIVLEPFEKTSWKHLKTNWQNKTTQIERLTALANAGYDFERHENAAKNTSAYAGNINFNTLTNTVVAYIAKDAKLSANENIKVNATAIDHVYDIAGVAAANGKTGAGASILVDVAKNDIQAYIDENAIVDVKKNLNVVAADNFELVTVMAGVAHGKETTGAGNIAVAVQDNEISSSIRSGAKVNTTSESNEQSVKVEGSAENKITKVGAGVAIQAGSGEQGAVGAVGATIDTNITMNKVDAYITNATVNATKSIDVNAKNSDKVIMVEAAGGASTNNTAGFGAAGMYIALNDVKAHIDDGSNINQRDYSDSIDKTRQKVNLNAESKFNEVLVTGALAGAKQTGVGASVRIDAVANDVKSYILDSNVNAQNALTLTNVDDMSQIAIVGAGAGSLSSSAGSGLISVLADVTTQKNYIENSVINVGELTMDTDKNLKNVSVVGAVAAGLSGVSVGVSAIAVGASHEIETYILNSTIDSKSYINLLSDFVQDSYIIAFGGAGGEGVAASGVVNVLVNDYDMNTYLKADSSSNKKNISTTLGGVNIRSKADVTTVSTNGNISASTSSVSAGGVVNTITYESNLKAGIDGITLNSANDVKIEAVAEEKHYSNAIGAEVAQGVAAGGIIESIDLEQNINAYLNNSDVTVSLGGVSLNSASDLFLKSGLGKVDASTGSAAVGGAIQTLVINQDIKSEINNSIVSAVNGNIENKSNASTTIKAVILGAAAASQAAIMGAVSTQVLNVDVNSIIQSSKLLASDESDKKIANEAQNKNEITATVVNGQGAGTAAVGGSVYSLVDNSKANAKIIGQKNGSTIDKANSLTNNANTNSKYTTTLINGSGAGTAGVSGVVLTEVVNSQANAVIENAKITNVADIYNISDNNSTLTNTTGQGAGAGVAAVGGTVNTIVSTKKSKAEIDNSSITASGKISNLANAKNTISSTLISGAGSGEVAVIGIANTIVSTDEVAANVVNSDISTSIIADEGYTDAGMNIAASDKISMTGRVISGQGSGGVSVGGTVITGVISNSVSSYIENSTLKADNANITITSTANETMGESDNPFLIIGGSGAGIVGVEGSVDTLVINSTSSSKVVSDDETLDVSELTAGKQLKIDASGNTDLVLGVGSGAGAGGVGVGATVNTVVIDKNINSTVDDAILTSETTKISAQAKDNIQTHTMSAVVVGAVDVSGIVNTIVVDTDINAGISDSVVYSDNISVNSEAKAKYLETAGQVEVGTVAAGATVATNVTKYNSSAYLKNLIQRGKDKTSKAKNIEVKSDILTDYELYAVSGAVAYQNADSGIIQTNVLNNTSKAYVINSDILSEKLTVNAKDDLQFSAFTNPVAIAQYGIGATIITNCINSNVLAYIGGGKQSNKKIVADETEVKAEGIQNFKDLFTLGLGGGALLGGAGSVLVNTIDATTKAYITEDSAVTADETLSLIAENTTKMTGTTGNDAVSGITSVATAIVVNKINKITEAYSANGYKTDKNGNKVDVGGNEISAKKIKIEATSNTNLGEENNKLKAGAGSASLGIGVIGTAIINSITNKTQAYIGNKNTVKNAKTLNINAENNTCVYETIGDLAIGLVGAGVGASAGIINIQNTVLAYINSDSKLTMSDGDIEINALSNEVVDATSAVVGAGALAGASGGGLSVSIGKEKGNNKTLIDEFTADDADSKKVFDNTDIQSNRAIKTSNSNKSNSNKNFIGQYNGVSDNVSNAIADVNAAINVNGQDDIKVENIEKLNENNYSLFETTNSTSSSADLPDMDNTTSAFIGSNVVISSAKDITLNAKNTNDIKLGIDGNAFGAAAIGVAIALSKVETSINSFVANNTNIDASGKIDVLANSVESQDLKAEAATGGIVSGTGVKSVAKSLKDTIAFVSQNSKLNTDDDINIAANSNEILLSDVSSANVGVGVGIGVSISETHLLGGSEAQVGNNSSLKSSKGKLSLKTNSTQKSQAYAEAVSGGVISGLGSKSKAVIDRKNAVKVGKNATLFSKLATLISSDAKNEVFSDNNGRANGGISLGGTPAISEIKYVGKVDLLDSDAKSNDSINAKSVEIVSNVKNNITTQANAGGGSLVGGNFLI